MLKPYALFDFDDTLIRGDSIVKLCFFAAQRGLMKPWTLLATGVMSALYLCRVVSAKQSKELALSFLKGMDEVAARKLAEEFCDQVLLPKLYSDGIDVMNQRAKDGCEVWLISASPAFYLEPLKKALPLTGIIATRMNIEEGVHTGQMVGENCRGVEKPLRLAEVLAARGDMVDYAHSYAYGDSAGDAPMLKLCGHKVAVNPKKKLRKILEGEDGVTVVHWK